MLINLSPHIRACPIIFLSYCYHPTLLILFRNTTILLLSHIISSFVLLVTCFFIYQDNFYFLICDKIIWYSLSHFPLISSNFFTRNGTMLSIFLPK